MIENVDSMPTGKLIASECAVESPTITSRRGNVAAVTGGATVDSVGTSVESGTATVEGTVVAPAAVRSNTAVLAVRSFAASNTASVLTKNTVMLPAMARKLTDAHAVRKFQS